MRIGEIAIIGTEKNIQKQFIKSVCRQVEVSNEQLTFGRLPIDEQITLHLYGIPVEKDNSKVSWDLLAKKILGYVVLFSWENLHSLDQVKATIDELTARYEANLVVAANLANGELSVHKTLLDDGIEITNEAKLIFCNVSDEESVRRVLLTLINLVIDKTA
jgi:signal recognition particle receptor subunit beta